MQLNFDAAPVEQKTLSGPVENFNSIINRKNLIWFVIGAGIFLRIFHFLDNRSLWRDEIYLATSLIEMDLFSLIFSPLEYEQKAPVGFLFLSKLAIFLLGKGELGLRLVPLLSGIFSLFVFLPVAQYFLKPLGVVVAMVILSFGAPIVFHSVEAKQYSTELLATIVVFYLFIKFRNKKELKSLLIWGLSGAIILCFSLSSVFVLAGLATGVSLHNMIEKDWKKFFNNLIPFAIWLAGFVAYYMFFLNRYSDSGWLVHWFRLRGAFMPLVPSSFDDIKWFLHAVYDLQRYPLGLMWVEFSHPDKIINVLVRMPLLPIIFFLAGMVAFYRKHRRHFLILVFPVILTLLASGLEKYPFYERLINFLAPVFILFLAAGCVYITGLLAKFGNLRFVLPALLLAVPVISSARQVVNPSLFGDYKRSQQRSAFVYINENFAPGDEVYINWNSLHAYRFYKTSYNLKFEAVLGKDPRFSSENYQEYFAQLRPDLDRLKGKKRVWLVYHKRVWDKIGDFDGQPEWYYNAGVAGGGDLLMEEFKEMGKETDSFGTGEFSVHLFDLSVK